MRELSNDELSKLTNDELKSLFLEVRSIINKSKKHKKNVWEKKYISAT